MREIKVLINDDDSAIEKRLSSLESAISKKNDNSFILQELRDLRKLIYSEEQKKEEDFSSKLGKLDTRLENVFKLVSDKINDVKESVSKKDEIKDLIINSNKTFMKQMESHKEHKEDKVDKKLKDMENMLMEAISSRPPVVYNNYTSINRGSTVIPYAA